MTILIPEAHDALADAVARRKAARGARGGRRVRPRWSRRVTGGPAIAIVIVSGVALAATTGWHPVLGGAGHGEPPLEAHRPVPADQLRALAVLRRPQQEADRAPEVRAALRLFSRDDINGIHVDAIRVLRRHADAVVMLVPAERSGTRSGPARTPVQREVLCLVSVLAIHSRFGSGHPSTKTALPRSVSAGYHCGDLRELRRTGILQGSAGRIGGVVPDGVAHVVVRTARHGKVSVPVRDNYFEMLADGEVAAPGPTEWLDDAGRVIATVPVGG